MSQGALEGRHPNSLSGIKRDVRKRARDAPLPPAKKLALCRTAPVTGPSGPQATPAQPEAVEVEAERRQRRQRVAEKLRCGMDVLQAVPGMERTLLLPEPELPPELLAPPAPPPPADGAAATRAPRVPQSDDTPQAAVPPDDPPVMPDRSAEAAGEVEVKAEEGSEASSSAMSDSGSESGEDSEEYEPEAVAEPKPPRLELPEAAGTATAATPATPRPLPAVKAEPEPPEPAPGPLPPPGTPSGEGTPPACRLLLPSSVVRPGEGITVRWTNAEPAPGRSLALSAIAPRVLGPVATVGIGDEPTGEAALLVPAKAKPGPYLVALLGADQAVLASARIKVLAGALDLVLAQHALAAGDQLQVEWRDQAPAEFEKHEAHLASLEVHLGGARPTAVATRSSVPELPPHPLGKHRLAGTAACPAPQRKGKYSLWYVVTDTHSFARTALGWGTFSVDDEVRLEAFTVEPATVRPQEHVTIRCQTRGHAATDALHITDDRGAEVAKLPLQFTVADGVSTAVVTYAVGDRLGQFDVRYRMAYGDVLGQPLSFTVSSKAPIRHFLASPVEQWPGGVVTLLWETDTILPNDRISIYSEEHKRVLRTWGLPAGSRKRQLNIPAPLPGKGRYTLRYLSGPSGAVAAETYFDVVEPPAARPGEFRVQVVVNRVQLRRLVHEGHSYVVAQTGLEYGLVLQSHAAYPALARICIDGKEAWKLEAIPPMQSVHVRGFRESMLKVRPMIFAEPQSMAASATVPQAQSDVGCIAVDVFPATQHTMEADGAGGALAEVLEDTEDTQRALQPAGPDREKKIEITTAFGAQAAVARDVPEQFRYLRAASGSPAVTLRCHYRSKDFMQIRQLVPTIYTWLAHCRPRVPRALQSRLLQTPHVPRPRPEALFPLLPSAPRLPAALPLAKAMVAPATAELCAAVRQASLQRVAWPLPDSLGEPLLLPQALAVTVFGDRAVDICGWMAAEIRNRGDRYGRHLVLLGVPSAALPALTEQLRHAGEVHRRAVKAARARAEDLTTCQLPGAALSPAASLLLVAAVALHLSVPITLYTAQHCICLCNETALDVGYALSFAPAPGAPQFLRLTHAPLLAERMRQLSAWDGSAAFRVVPVAAGPKLHWKDRTQPEEFIVIDEEDEAAEAADEAEGEGPAAEDSSDGEPEDADGPMDAHR